MRCVIRRRKPNLQIGYALLNSKLGEFTGFGEDPVLLLVNFAVLLRDGKWGKGISLS